jgi:hypothetical protein
MRYGLSERNGVGRKIMCTFLSFYVGWDGEIYAGDLKTHRSAEEERGLAAALKSAQPPVPVEWTEDDAGASISARVPSSIADRDENYYRSVVLGDYEDRTALIRSLLDRPHPGKLDLEGCTGLTSLPDGLSVGGRIYR